MNMSLPDNFLMIMLWTSIFMLVFVHIIIYPLILKRRTEQWRVTKGKILQLQNEKNDPNEKIKYEYEAFGLKYKSSRIDLLSKHPMLQNADRYKNLIGCFEENQEIDVYYNPEDSSDAVLIKEVNITSKNLIITVCFFVFFVLPAVL